MKVLDLPESPLINDVLLFLSKMCLFSVDLLSHVPFKELSLGIVYLGLKFTEHLLKLVDSNPYKESLPLAMNYYPFISQLNSDHFNQSDDLHSNFYRFYKYFKQSYKENAHFAMEKGVKIPETIREKVAEYIAKSQKDATIE